MRKPTKAKAVKPEPQEPMPLKLRKSQIDALRFLSKFRFGVLCRIVCLGGGKIEAAVAVDGAPSPDRLNRLAHLGLVEFLPDTDPGSSWYRASITEAGRALVDQPVTPIAPKRAKEKR